MAIHLAFLRAINLGRTRVFPKGDIHRVVTALGFEDVETHINTGNVRFDTRLRSHTKIELALEQAFAADRGFAVPTIVFSAREFRDLADDAQALAAEHSGMARHYVYLLSQPPESALAERIEATSGEQGDMVVRGRTVHALLRPGYRAGVVDPLRAAKLMPDATARTLTVITTIADKWC